MSNEESRCMFCSQSKFDFGKDLWSNTETRDSNALESWEIGNDERARKNSRI